MVEQTAAAWRSQRLKPRLCRELNVAVETATHKDLRRMRYQAAA
jgi:hypothetical protein